MAVWPETVANAGSSLASLMFVWATLRQFCPKAFQNYIERLWYRLTNYFNPIMSIRFDEYSGGLYKRSAAYTAIGSYVGSKSQEKASRVKAEFDERNQRPPVFSMDDYEQIVDVFQGVKITWYGGKYIPQSKTISWSPGDDDRRYYLLTCKAKHRKLITEQYLRHVQLEGNALNARRRSRRLYMNVEPTDTLCWNYVNFEHPATFDTFAMDPQSKEELVNDLIAFSKGKEYYAKIGKAWKRGYLLYGPPGTGKSTMIAAMSNLLGYDIYDLELTTVKDNAQLKKLLINTTGRSIIVIEDIDCSLDLTGQRKVGKAKDRVRKDKLKMKARKQTNDGGESKVTLSGLLNFIDGVWSGCGGERIIVFTTNYIEDLDPALIRRGRMDKHIELSYCSFGAFKVLAKNYLDIDSHPLFEKINELLGETNMTPADVAENLTPKTLEKDVELCLKSLIRALEIAREKANLKGKEEEKETDDETELEGKGEEAETSETECT